MSSPTDQLKSHRDERSNRITKQTESFRGGRDITRTLTPSGVEESGGLCHGLLPPLRGFGLYRSSIPTVETVCYYRSSLRDKWPSNFRKALTPIRAANLSLNHCQERGQPCPREPKSRNSRTKLSALLSVAISWSRCAMLESRSLPKDPERRSPVRRDALPARHAGSETGAPAATIHTHRLILAMQTEFNAKTRRRKPIELV